MAQLPVVVRRDIRDKIDAAEGPVQQQILSLQETIGLPVHVEVNWPYLWAEYEQIFVEKTTFVPYVLPYISTLLDALGEKLEDDTSDWTEKLLEVVTQCKGLKVDLQTCKQLEPNIEWLNGKVLTLYIPLSPKTAPIPSVHLMLKRLEELFAVKSKKEMNPNYEASRPSTSSSIDGMNTPLSTISLNTDFSRQMPELRSEIRPLPTLEALPRPDLLLAQSGVHIIHMRIERDRQYMVQTPAHSNLQNLPDRIVIQSTHGPSLKLMHDYFTKWTRPEIQTREKVPLLRHTLYTSAIGHGQDDTLIAEPFSQVTVRNGNMVLNPALYQCFIQTTLRYQVVHRSSASYYSNATWEFHRYHQFV